MKVKVKAVYLGNFVSRKGSVFHRFFLLEEGRDILVNGSSSSEILIPGKEYFIEVEFNLPRFLKSFTLVK